MAARLIACIRKSQWLPDSELSVDPVWYVPETVHQRMAGQQRPVSFRYGKDFFIPDLCNKFGFFQETSRPPMEACFLLHSSSVYRSFIPVSLNISSEDPA